MTFSIVKFFLKQVHGMDLAMYDDAFIEKSLINRMQETHCASPDEYRACLEYNQAELKILNESLLIHYSEFFRDQLTFALLERVILPELIQKKKNDKRGEIRIWSAGCAAGQEAYSLAILLEEALTNPTQNLNYRIFATDLDETLLNEARLGRYHAAALSNVSLKRAQTWFTKQDEYYIVQPAIQQNIDFSIFDLINEEQGCPPSSIFGDFDLVFCCNVLIYYQPRYRDLILNKFLHCLASGGTLVTGETERTLALAHHYSEVVPQAAIFRLRQEHRNLP